MDNSDRLLSEILYSLSFTWFTTSNSKDKLDFAYIKN